MKAVVLEVRDGLAAVLREDGTVEKLRRSCRVGETIELAETGGITRLHRKTVKWVAAAAAALVILSAGGTWGYNNAFAYSYVTLDADSAISYTLNRRNRVIEVEALDEDAESIVESLTGRGSTLTEAIAETTELLYAEDSLRGGDCILINISSRSETQREALEQEVDAFFDAREAEEGGPTVYVTNATREELEKANELGVNPGRYMLIQDILERDGRRPEDMTASERGSFDRATVGELMEADGLRPEAEPAPPETAGVQPAGPAVEPQDSTAAPGQSGEMNDPSSQPASSQPTMTQPQASREQTPLGGPGQSAGGASRSSGEPSV